MAECQTPNLGRIVAVGLFLADQCLSPIYGPNAGYIDTCPAGFTSSDNIDDGEDFTRRCTNGTIKYFRKGTRSLQDIEVNVDLHWIDPDWLSAAGGAAPIVHNGEIIGWGDKTRSATNLIVVVWQEIFSDAACDPTSSDVGCNHWVRVYPVLDARITEEGDPGAEDNYIRVTGNTTASSAVGSGPIPLACDAVTGDAEWLSNCIPAGSHRGRFIGGPPPEVCGTMTTVAPTVPCVEESPAA